MNASRRQLAVLRSLRTRKGRQETGLFLVEGVRLCAELLAANVAHPPSGVRFPADSYSPAEVAELRRAGATGRHVEFVLIAEGLDKSGELGELAARFASSAGAQVVTAPLRDFERISDTVHSQGILAAARWNDLAADALQFGPFDGALRQAQGREHGRAAQGRPERSPPPRFAVRSGGMSGDRATVLALDAVSDPGNVGTVIRTAAWFGASAVLLGEGCADLLNPKTVRATMGGIFQLPICRDIKLNGELGRLKQLGFRVTAATMDGFTDWRGWAENPRSALVLGSEARGVNEEICRLADQRVTIPRRGAGESLNVAVSAGILLSVL